MRKLLLLTLCLLLCMVVASASAWADSESWYFTGSNTQSQVPCTPSAPCGEITITTSGNMATITVSSLLSGYVFDTFGFNSSQAISLVPGSGTGELGTYSIPGGGNQDGFGSFNYIFDTGKNGGSSGGDCVVTGGVPGAGCTFSFKVQCSGSCTLSLSNFEITSSGGNGSGFFAGHLADGNGNTGYVGDTMQFQVDEPASLSVVGSGLLLVGALLRRRVFAAR